MAKVGVGLDIGTNSVKVVELAGGNRIRLNKFGSSPLPENAIKTGVVSDRYGVSSAIQELMKEHKIQNRKIVLAIAGQSVIVRHIKMPIMSEAEMAGAIRGEAERYIPFPIEEVCLDFKILSASESQNETDVMLVCAHNDIIYSHIETIKDIGLQPIAIDIQPLAMMRAMGFEKVKTDRSVALLDIGAGTTDLMIIKDGIPLFTRVIPLAGNQFTENIGKNLNLSIEEAENVKLTKVDALYDLNPLQADTIEYQANFVMQEGLRELVVEIRRSFDYLQLQQRDEEIGQLILSGGGSKINNLAAYLTRELGLPVASGNLIENLLVPEKYQMAFLEEAPFLTVALGLALREVIPE